MVVEILVASASAITRWLIKLFNEVFHPLRVPMVPKGRPRLLHKPVPVRLRAQQPTTVEASCPPSIGPDLDAFHPWKLIVQR